MLIVKSIKPYLTYEWLLKKHYAKRLCNIMYAFGLFDNNIIVGVLTYGKPASNSLCIGVCGEQYKSEVIELNRLCVDHPNPNASSILVGRSLRMLPKPSIIVSYADTSMNHIGYVYQATNWIYTGLSAKRTERYNENDPSKHPRWANSGMAIRQRPQKHRYIYIHGTKAQKKKRRQALNYPPQPYPKGDTQRYDASHKPTIQPELF